MCATCGQQANLCHSHFKSVPWRIGSRKRRMIVIAWHFKIHMVELSFVRPILPHSGHQLLISSHGKQDRKSNDGISIHNPL